MVASRESLIRARSSVFGRKRIRKSMIVLDESEAVLGPGSVVIQRGTDHRWENRSGAPARMAFILVDGAFAAGLRDTLPGAALEALLEDPMAPGERE